MAGRRVAPDMKIFKEMIDDILVRVLLSTRLDIHCVDQESRSTPFNSVLCDGRGGGFYENRNMKDEHTYSSAKSETAFFSFHSSYYYFFSIRSWRALGL